MYRLVLKSSNHSIRVVEAPSRLTLKQKVNNVNIRTTGKQGPRGEQGVGVPAGGRKDAILSKASSADYDYVWLTSPKTDKNFTKNFTVSSTVLVDHMLEKYPAVTVLDSAGDEVEGHVYHISENQLEVRFSAPFSGRVICN